MRVTAAQFITGYGSFADAARLEPVTITQDGRDHLILLSAEEYARLRRCDRQAFWTEQRSDEEIASIAKAEVPADHTHLSPATRSTLAAFARIDSEHGTLADDFPAI